MNFLTLRSFFRILFLIKNISGTHVNMKLDSLFTLILAQISTRCTHSQATCSNNESPNIQLSAFQSRLSTTEYSLALLQEQINNLNQRVIGDFDITGWSKVEKSWSKKLYYKLLSAEKYTFMDALRACKELRPDSQLAQVFDDNEMDFLFEMTKNQNGPVVDTWVAAMNTDEHSTSVDRYFWIHSGKVIDEKLHYPGENGFVSLEDNEPCMRLHREYNGENHFGLLNLHCNHKFNAACEIRT